MRKVNSVNRVGYRSRNRQVRLWRSPCEARYCWTALIIPEVETRLDARPFGQHHDLL